MMRPIAMIGSTGALLGEIPIDPATALERVGMPGSGQWQNRTPIAVPVQRSGIVIALIVPTAGDDNNIEIVELGRAIPVEAGVHQVRFEPGQIRFQEKKR